MSKDKPAPKPDLRNVRVGDDATFYPPCEAAYLTHYGFPAGQRFKVIGTRKPGALRMMTLRWPGSDVEILARKCDLRRVPPPEAPIYSVPPAPAPPEEGAP